jgi:hypothetical protein
MMLGPSALYPASPPPAPAPKQVAQPVRSTWSQFEGVWYLTRDGKVVGRIRWAQSRRWSVDTWVASNGEPFIHFEQARRAEEALADEAR